MTEKIEVDTGIEDPDQRESLVESIRLQAKQQGLRAEVYANHTTRFTIKIDGNDEGHVLAFAAALTSWARKRT